MRKLAMGWLLRWRMAYGAIILAVDGMRELNETEAI